MINALLWLELKTVVTLPVLAHVVIQLYKTKLRPAERAVHISEAD